jgi:DNA-nicking Smr family endonuclease
MKRNASTKTIHIIGGTASLVPPTFPTFVFSYKTQGFMKLMKGKTPSQDMTPGPLSHNPFEGIKKLLKDKKVAPLPLQETQTLRKTVLRKGGVAVIMMKPEEERVVFLEAMEDVAPLIKGQEREIRRDNPSSSFSGAPPVDENREALEQLTKLVTTGEGFILSLTPEYIEGTGYNVHSEYARRLHAGDFSIQAHIDLHGLTVVEAKEVFDGFMQEAVMTGKTGVLIIHGRGLSSPGEPVLKKKVIEWLTSGVWRKRIFAYASARSCDGGTGATYALFRPRARGKYSRHERD